MIQDLLTHAEDASACALVLADGTSADDVASKRAFISDLVERLSSASAMIIGHVREQAALCEAITRLQDEHYERVLAFWNDGDDWCGSLLTI